MKHKAEVTIDADPLTVWRYFDNPDNLSKWQPTLKSVSHKSGRPGHPDAVTELIYEDKGRRTTMIETITARREPDFLAGILASDHFTAVVVNHFEKTDDGGTHWIAYWNRTFRGAMRFTTLFSHGAIRKRVDDDMNRLKLLVETAEAGGEA